jgi:hypothetical protein
MTTACDLFSSIAGDSVDPDVMLGFETLMRAAPLWPMNRGVFWTDIVARARAFAERWDGACRSSGWSTLQLYGVDPNAPSARVSRLGVAWLVAKAASQVLEVTPNVIRVATRSAARLSIYKGPPDPDTALPWELLGEA